MRSDAAPERGQRRSPLRLTAVIAVAIAAGLIVWPFVRDNGDSGSKKTKSQTTTSSSTGKRVRPLLAAATRQRLISVSAAAKQPIYWAGPKRGVTYELTRTTDDRYFVRYLPKGVRVGNRTGEYLLVGTYPVDNAYGAVQRAAKETGAATFSTPGGGLAVVNSRAPKNVYFAFPHTKYQVEVFDPSARRARQLVASGAVKPVR
jgi:hypothetical protein